MQWRQQDIKFSALYSGYIGNISQLKNLEKVMQTCLEQDALKIIDPAMADDGRLYPGFDQNFVDAVKVYISNADYLLPNITEACLLTGTPYREKYDEDFIKNLLKKLSGMGCRNIVLTGVAFNEDKIGVAVYEDGEYSYLCHEKVARSSPGTGDIFASVFTGAVLKGYTACESARMASQFVVKCLKETEKYPQHTYGPVFEPLLAELIKMLNK